MGKPSGKRDNRGRGRSDKKEFFTTFTVQNSSGTEVDGVFGFQAYSARKAQLTSRQQIGALHDSLPQNSGYRRGTVSLSNEVYTDRSNALAKIGVYDTKTDMNGKLLIEVR